MASTPLAVTFSRLSRSAFSTSVLPEIERTGAPLTAQTEHPRRDANSVATALTLSGARATSNRGPSRTNLHVEPVVV